MLVLDAASGHKLLLTQHILW